LSKQNPLLPKGCVVDVVGIWGEGYYSYPGRFGILICQKSAEAIFRWHSILLSATCRAEHEVRD